MTKEQAVGLLGLLMTNSQLSNDLNAMLDPRKKPLPTADAMWDYFLAKVAPLGIGPGDLDRDSVEALWTDDGKTLKPQFNASNRVIEAAFTPPLVYDPGPCPNGVLQISFMNKLK